MPKAQCPGGAHPLRRLRQSSFGHWGLVIHWSLVIGHWSLVITRRSLVIGSLCSRSSTLFPPPTSERGDLLPHAVQPAFALVVANRPFGDEAHAGVGHVVTEAGVVRIDILA